MSQAPRGRFSQESGYFVGPSRSPAWLHGHVRCGSNACQAEHLISPALQLPATSVCRCSGSCWIWAALGAVESKVLIQYNKHASSFPINLAEEQLVDCFGGNGCDDGGWPNKAMAWIAQKGIVQEGYYPVSLHVVNGVPTSLGLMSWVLGM